MIYGEQSNSVLKLKPNGMLDPNFGNNGKLEFVENNFMNAVLQGDKIIINFGPNASNFSNPYEGSKKFIESSRRFGRNNPFSVKMEW